MPLLAKGHFGVKIKLDSFASNEIITMTGQQCPFINPLSRNHAMFKLYATAPNSEKAYLVQFKNETKQKNAINLKEFDTTEQYLSIYTIDDEHIIYAKYRLLRGSVGLILDLLNPEYAPNAPTTLYLVY